MPVSKEIKGVNKMAKRSGRRKKGKASKVLFIIEMLVLLVLVTGIFAYAKVNESMDNFQKDAADSSTGDSGVVPTIQVNEGVTGNANLSGYRNIALVGIDTRDGDINYANSDTMIIASIDNDHQQINMFSLYRDTYLNIGEDSYNKANAAYCRGSANQFLSMINTNLDLAVSDYVVVDFDAVSQLIDDLGGITVTMTADEVTHMNNYCVETSKVTGKSYEKIMPEVEGTYQLNGVQGVAYARIRYTAGNDFKRTQRQRLVIEKIVEKLKKKGVTSFGSIANDVFPLVKTNMSKAEIIELGTNIIGYNMNKTTGFPFIHVEDNIGDLDPVIPVTLEENVRQLHEWLFGDTDYQPSATVQDISYTIEVNSGYGESYIERAKELSESANKAIGSEADNM